jgi:hypothetical protein
MNFRDSLDVWRRRWLLTASLLIVALLAAIGAASSMRTYQGSASVILLASRSAARQTGGNPYLSFSPTLTLSADALSRAAMAPATAQSLAARGYVGGTYTVALAPYTTNTTGSVLLVTATGPKQAAVSHLLAGVRSELSTELLALQRGVSASSRIRTATLSNTPRATLSGSATARSVTTVVALGLLLALGIPLAVDGRAARRRPPAAASQDRWDHTASSRSATSS